MNQTAKGWGVKPKVSNRPKEIQKEVTHVQKVEQRSQLYDRIVTKRFKEELPFETIYMEDPDLKVGDIHVSYKGSKGEITTIVKEYYKGAELIEKDSLIERLTQPQNQIVYFGTNIKKSKHVDEFVFDKKYTILNRFAKPIMPNDDELIGLDEIIELISVSLHKDDMSNAVLTADAGVGKTATMQEYAKRYPNVLVYTISIAAMNERKALAKNLEMLFDELMEFKTDERTDKEIIIFIDEFHQWPMFSKESVESLKPQLARSAKMGIHIIGATTYDEYIEHIQPNKALTDRFPRINIPSPNDETVYQILKNKMRKQNTVVESDASNAILRKIIHNSNIHMQNRSQPRKSLDILDFMISYCKLGYKFDDELLDKIFYRLVNVRLSFNFDAGSLKEQLNKLVFDQPYAVNRIVGHCYSIMLGVIDHNKPLGSFLFPGSTGVGKTELAKALATCLFGPDQKPLVYDMSEYHSDDPDAPNVFKHRLTDDMVSVHPQLILIDEVEKAHPQIPKLFYSILDEGRISDRYGRTTSFSNVLFIFTTNVTEDIMQKINERNLKTTEIEYELEREMPNILSNLQTSQTFPAALLGRLNAIAPFGPLTNATIKKIAERKLLNMKEDFKTRQGVQLNLDMEPLVDLVSFEKYKNDSNSGGARQINNLVSVEVRDKISEYILMNKNHYNLYVQVAGDTMAKNDSIIRSNAHVRIVSQDENITEQSTINQQAVDQIWNKQEQQLDIKLSIPELYNDITNIQLDYNVILKIYGDQKGAEAIAKNILAETIVSNGVQPRDHVANQFTKILKDHLNSYPYQTDDEFVIGIANKKIVLKNISQSKRAKMMTETEARPLPY